MFFSNVWKLYWPGRGVDAIKVAKGTRKKPGTLTRAKEAKREAIRSATAAAEKDPALVEKIERAEKAGEAKVAVRLRRC